MKGYGSFCPVAKAAEILTERWTPLLLRELLLGSRHFNELRRGIPQMSPTLLSKRLRAASMRTSVLTTLYHGACSCGIFPRTLFSTRTKVPRHRRARSTCGLHFPHRQLILCVSGGARAPIIGGRPRIGSLRYLFEEYAFDTDRRELHRGADIVSVAPQVFDLLDYLIRNRERVVSKDDLINAIWNGRSVSDAALTTRLNVARSAIGDSGEEQRFIKTLPRKGFRFVGPVREAQRPASVAVTDTPAQRLKPALPLPDKPSIAVLPFTNLSSDPEQDYFADGMVEDIITALSRFKALFVIARSSSFTYKGRAVDIKQVGRELGVRYVLVGSVRKAASRVRITGQLVDTTTGAHLWADRFDGGIGDVFDLQDQVTESVVGAIAPAVEKAEIERAKRKPTESLDAYALYLRGLARLYQFASRHANDEALRLLNSSRDRTRPGFCVSLRSRRLLLRLCQNQQLVFRHSERDCRSDEARSAGGRVGQGRRDRDRRQRVCISVCCS